MTEAVIMNEERKHLHKLMSDAHIGKRFQTMSLKSFGSLGERYIGRIQDGSFIEVLDVGTGVSTYGAKSYDFSMLLIKALLLSDMTVAHVSLAGMSRAISDWDFAQKITDVDCLLITRFCSDISQDSPIDKYSRMQIEDLILDRWDNGQPVFIQSVEKLETYKDWWSPTLIRKFAELNEVVEVK